MSYDYDEEDPTFVDDLLESAQYVNIVADWLRGLGHDVRVNPVRVRPSPNKMSNYADDGDILLDDKYRIEVKRRPDIHFSSVSDFPYNTIIVDAAHCWDRARAKPSAYFILNSDATTAILVRGNTRKSWLKVKRYDRQKHRWRWFYECPLGLCEERAIKCS